MSPTMLVIARRVERETRQLAMTPYFDDDGTRVPDSARYPRDYIRPVELLRRWRGAGRFFYS